MKRKIIIYILSVITLYYFLSVYFTKNGQFVQHYFSYSNSKNESKERGLFLTDKINYKIIKDSLGIIQNDFSIWIDKIKVTKQYGLLPIKYTYENDFGKNLEIDFNENTDEVIKDRIYFKINNGDVMNRYTVSSFFIKVKDTIRLDFYDKLDDRMFGSVVIIYK